jgi:serine/threonine protein kinase
MPPLAKSEMAEGKPSSPSCEANVSTLTKAGRYEIREELGRGAMGVVYRAHDPVIGRDVAVKTLHLSEEGTGMTREELVKRFQTEARAAGQLTHPNIVVIHDAGEDEGKFYITMELVEGRSLQSMIDGRQIFTLPRILKIMEQACSALDYAHQRNVVHRDIKPANLMLTDDDTLKITDFGTAKILQFGTVQTATVMGTPSYMSPEQVKGKVTDGRSDIFSLGVILYELVTGEKPFPGQNITTVIYKIINEEPIAARDLDSTIHPGLSAVISRALAKGPAARFQTCRELWTALKNFHEQVDPSNGKSSGTTTAPAGLHPAQQAHTAENHAGVTPELRQDLEAAGKRGTFLLTIILLAVIGFAGYRVWPPMKELWQRMHEPPETPVVMPKTSLPASPATQGQDIPAVKDDAPAPDDSAK